MLRSAMRTHGPADLCLNKGTADIFKFYISCLRECTPGYVKKDDKEEVFLEKQGGPLHNPGQAINAMWVEDGTM